MHGTVRAMSGAIVAAMLLAAPAAAEWAERVRPARTLDSGGTVGPTYEVVGTARSEDTAEDLLVRVSCETEPLDDFNLQVRVPWSMSNFADEDPSGFLGNIYEFNTSVHLDGGDARPVRLHQVGVYGFPEDEARVVFNIGLRSVFGADMSGADVAAAIAHLSGARPRLAFRIGHDIRRPRPLFDVEITLDGIGPSILRTVVANCPDVLADDRVLAHPDGLAPIEMGRAFPFWFENTRHRAAQRQSLLARAERVLGGDGAPVITCPYIAENGQRRYQFWHQDVPRGVGELIRASGRPDGRGSRLGLVAVNRCPETEDLARLLRSISPSGWPR